MPASRATPKPSRVTRGTQVVPSSISAVGAAGRVETASRSSICTKTPDSGSVDHSALAVTWNSTTCPCPSALRVTSGVPSASAAMVRSASVGSGCATIWLLTVTSSGTSRPKNGEVASKGRSALGSPQESAPPTVRPPERRRTGISGSSTSRPTSEAARFGPAKRNSSPPSSTQAATRSVSDGDSRATSAITSTSGPAGSSVSRSPSIRSAVGASALRR